MEAKLLPLEGKYYGSRVEIFDDRGDSAGWVIVWLNAHREEDYKPSEREQEAWDEMLKRDVGEEEFHSLPPEEREYEISDNHYESALGYKVCKLLVEAVNGSA